MRISLADYDRVCTYQGGYELRLGLDTQDRGTIPDKSLRGFMILIRLSRAVLPDITVTCDFGTSHCLPRNPRRCSLALPSAGGAVIRIFKASPTGPVISSRAARGWIRRRSIRSSPSHRYQDAAKGYPKLMERLAMGATTRIFSNCSTIKATSGEKSMPDMGGMRRRAGASKGSAIL